MSENNNLNEEEANEEELQLDNKKTILSWSFYDWANSAFATTVMAGFFPLFFEGYWASGNAISILGYSNSIASIIVAILAPFLGAIADRMSGKKKFLLTFALLGILTTGALNFIAIGLWQWAVVLFILGTIGFSGANIFYDALLPSVASEKKIDYVSSLGFSLGYIGGGLLFALNVLWFLMPTTFGFADANAAIKFSFMSVAIWWAIFTIPIMIFVKEPKTEKGMTFGKAISEGMGQLRDTFRDIKHLKYVGLFLLGYWFYIDGVDTIIRMAVIYGTELGFPGESLIIALLLVQFVAFPGTLLYNLFAKKIGVKKAILVAIIAYGVITIFGSLMTLEWHFYVLAFFIGCFQGGIQALSRSIYSRLIPKHKAAQFYGFFNMLGKFAAVIGPALMALITDVTGDVRIGILSILSLFIIGGVILYFVDMEKGEKMADEFLEIQ
ncbi:MAG: MFS transporter [Promethearchaeota archaeon]